MLKAFDEIKLQLSRKLPGIAAQMKMAPVTGIPLNFDNQRQKAAVLVLLYPHDDSLYTLLIKRNEYEGPHSGQISLPGGKFETHDLDLATTSLRETAEETGINASKINIIGRLTTLEIPVSNFEVHPFVGCTCKKPDFSPDPTEVEYLIEAELNVLANPDIRKTKCMNIGEYAVELPYYDYNGNHIWGATAMMLAEFLEVFRMAVIKKKTRQKPGSDNLLLRNLD
jgi:8-oxo-dGTP pyrophosphatase MutT (NUDIX family)